MYTLKYNKQSPPGKVTFASTCAKSNIQHKGAKRKQCNFNEGQNHRFQKNDRNKVSFHAIMLMFYHILTPSLFYVVVNLFVCGTKTVESITVRPG